MPRHFDAKRVEIGLNLAVAKPQTRQHLDQLLCRVHADAVVEDSPADLEHADKVVSDEKIVGQRRSGLDGRRTAACLDLKPATRPVLQAKVADGGGRVGRLLHCKGPRLDGTSGNDRVRQISELLGPHRIGGEVPVASELHVSLDTREPRRGTPYSAEQASRRLCEDARFQKHVDEGGDRICGAVRSGRRA